MPNILFGYSPDAKRPAPPLQPPPPKPQHPGECIPYQQHLRSNRRYDFPFQGFPNGYSENLSCMQTKAVRSYVKHYPLDGYLSHQASAERQLKKSLEPRSRPHPFQPEFLDHNAVGNVEGEEDSRDISERRALETVLNPPPAPPRSFIEELKWLVLIFIFFLAASGVAPFIIGATSSILCLIVRWLVRCLGCQRCV